MFIGLDRHPKTEDKMEFESLLRLIFLRACDNFIKINSHQKNTLPLFGAEFLGFHLAFSASPPFPDSERE